MMAVQDDNISFLNDQEKLGDRTERCLRIR